MMLRHEFSELYPSMKPDEIYNSNYWWILNELTLKAEKSMIAENVAEIMKEQSESKSKK